MIALPLVARAASDPDGWAIRSDTHGDATWSTMAERDTAARRGNRRSTSARHRRLLVVARNRPSTVLAHAAAALGEAASVPVNFQLTSGEIEYIAGEAGARLAFVDSTTEAAVRDAVAGLDVAWSSVSRRRHRRTGARRDRR